ncbi:cholecystokinin receptor-like [Patiria miniata]|uniref:G-protein coupled receptors family 1 profile domain-containing protein n=1 Tax=Patiria miniata TaxID=46514 RepID=A0A913ZS95_PATMI|nr:cholecystokinin receptor-like [Patiria miniata]
MADISLIYRICETIIGVLGVLGNGLIITVIWRVPFMHTSSIAIICHQAIIDFLGSLLLLLQRNIPVPAQVPQTFGGELLCRVWIGDVTLFLLFVASTYNLLALTLGRYFNIVHPLRFRLMQSRKGVAAVIVIVWLLAPLIKTYSFLHYSVVDGQCNFRQLPASKVMGPLIICLQFFLPMVIMLYCYIHMAVALKRQAKLITLKTDDVGQDNTTAEVGRAAQMHQQHQLLKVRRDIFETLVVVFVTFVVCWAPSQVAYFMFNIGLLELDVKGPVHIISTIMTASNCCLNPIIYCFKYKLFRRAMRTMIGRPDNEQFDGLIQTAATNTTQNYNMQELKMTVNE